MPGITFDPGDAAELAEMLAFLADWLSGSQKQGPRRQPGRLRRPPRLHNADTLCADKHRFVFLLGASDGELFGEPTL